MAICAALRFLAATKNTDHESLPATALAKTGCTIHTRREKHRLKMRRILRWRMPKKRIWRMRVYTYAEGGGHGNVFVETDYLVDEWD